MWLPEAIGAYLRNPISTTRFRTAYRCDKVLILACVIVLGFAGSAYMGNVWTTGFNDNDDYHAYLVFPHKMLQTGAMGDDPFSERRLVTSLGGQSFLHTLALCRLPNEAMGVVDPGVSLLLLALLMLEIGTHCKCNRFLTLTLVAAPLCIAMPKVNSSSLVSGLLLLLTTYVLLSTQGTKEKWKAGSVVMLSMLLAGMCALKSTFIPVAAFIVITHLIVRWSQIKERPLLVVCELLSLSVLVAAFLLPWMLSMLHSSGTLLYPVLGSGFHGSVYGHSSMLPPGLLSFHNAIRPIVSSLDSMVLIGVLLLACGYARAFGSKLSESHGWLVPMISSVGGAVSLSTSGVAASRYTFPIAYAAVLALVSALLFADARRSVRLCHDRNDSVSTNSFLVVFCLVIAFASGTLLSGVRMRSSRTAPSLDDANTAARYRRILRSVPKGETVLTRLDKPYLLGFRDHQVFIADWPGGASPPPGLPFGKGGEALSRYLIVKDVRYVAYSYRNSANFSWNDYKDRVKPGYPDHWIQSVAISTFDFQRSLIELGQSRKRIYDDGSIFVLDLKERR
ncbi:MAG: hypothetical protein NT018_00290 [Armatimonadetes bacterium]|nr:hypothetical protein [Armatimonadota bacterium]